MHGNTAVEVRQRQGRGGKDERKVFGRNTRAGSSRGVTFTMAFAIALGHSTPRISLALFSSITIPKARTTRIHATLSPQAYGVLLRHVTSLGYADTPDYETLIMNFATLYYECGGKEDTPYHFGICEDKDLIYPIKCVSCFILFFPFFFRYLLKKKEMILTL